MYFYQQNGRRLRDCLQVLLETLSKFKRIIELLFVLISSENIRAKIWGQSLSILAAISYVFGLFPDNHNYEKSFSSTNYVTSFS